MEVTSLLYHAVQNDPSRFVTEICWIFRDIQHEKCDSLLVQRIIPLQLIMPLTLTKGCLGIPLYIISYVGYKFANKIKIVKPAEADLFSGRQER